MKSVKLSIIAATCVLVAACAQKVALPGLEDKVELKETSQFIPRQAYDEKQMAIIYEPKENPYLSQRGRVDKGSVLLFIEAKKAIKKKDFKTAKSKLLVITGNDDSLAGPWVLMGEIAQEQKEFERAVEYYQKAININPKNINAYTGLAHVQRQLGKFNIAQNTLAEALRIWPDFPEAHLNIGVLYDVYLNKPVMAQKHMEAFLFLSKKDTEEAQEWFEEVKGRTGIVTSFVDLGPENPKAETPKEEKEAVEPKADSASKPQSGGDA